MERRHILLATVVSAAGLLVATGLLVFPETTKLWLPTFTTIRAAAHSLGEVNRASATEVAPAFPLPPLFLAALIAVWASAFSSHALAARARSPLLALLPPAALLAFADLILDDGARPFYVLAFLIAALGLLFADGTWSIQQWGPATAWRGRGKGAIGAGVGGRGARRVGLACLGIALFAPWILPGYRAGGLVDTQTGRSGVGVSINPIVDIRPQLQHPTTPLFTVEASRPAYWRMVSLDAFDGETWRSSRGSPGGAPVSPGSLPPNDPNNPTEVGTLTQVVTFDQLRSIYLPAAYPPVRMTAVPPGMVRYDPMDSLLEAPAGTDKGFSYTVVSDEVTPAPDQLDAITSLTPFGNDLRYTQVPDNTPDRIRQIAHQWTDDQPTPFGKILAIQDRLRTTFHYDLSPPAAPKGTNQIQYFLTTSKTGYCVQFASAMAVLLRELGIPARVAVGFTPGTPDPKDHSLWRVNTGNAHTWVEVLFPGLGWLSFEPTPTRENPVARSYAFPPATATQGSSPQCRISFNIAEAEKACGNSTSAPTTSPRSRTEPLVPPPRRGGRGASSPSPIRGHRTWPLWVAASALLLLLLAAIPLWKVIRWRIAAARATGPRDLVLASYRVLAADAADLGWGRRPDETLWEYRARLRVDSAGVSSDELDQLIGLTGRAAYSDRDITAAQADRAAATARRAARGLRHSAPLTRQLTGRFRLRWPVRAARWATT